MSAAPLPSRAASWFAWFRLGAAVVLTTLLTLGWGRTFIFTLFLGRPEAVAAAATAAVFGIVLLLTWNLRERFGLPLTWTKWDSRLLLLLLALWCLAYVVLFGWYISALNAPRWQLLLVFIPSTLWLLFLSWFGYWPGPAQRKTALLLLLLLLALDFPLLARVDGMTGDGQVNLAWRTRWLPGPAGAEARPARTAPIPTGPASRIEAWSTSPRDFPRYLGSRGDATLPEAKIAGDWSKQPPKELWRVPVGEGWSSFAIVGDHCFTQEQAGDLECVVCRELRTGKEVWRHADPVRFDGSLGGPGPRATPTVTATQLFSVGGTGLLNCLEPTTGKSIWSVDLMKDNGCGSNLSHGVCGSPLVHDGTVYVSPPGEGGPCLVAYDQATGSRRWRAGKQRASYSSPQLHTLLGVPQILVYHSEGVSAFEPATGRELWSHPWTNSVRVNASQPVLIQDDGKAATLLVSTGYDQGSTLVRLHREGADWKVAATWSNRLLQTKFTTAVRQEKSGKVFGLDNGILCCLDPLTGKRLWKAGRYNHGQILLAGDSHLIVQTEEGAVVLVEADEQKLLERGRLRALKSKTWNHPALAGRFLLVRNDTEAICYELP